MQKTKFSGNLTPVKLWLNIAPNSKISRVFGKSESTKHWLKPKPNARLRSCFGMSTPSKLWLNSHPNLKLWRLLGHFTSSKLWLKVTPKVISSMLSGRFTSWRRSLKLSPKLKLFLGADWRDLSPQRMFHPPILSCSMETGRIPVYPMSFVSSLLQWHGKKTWKQDLRSFWKFFSSEIPSK